MVILFPYVLFSSVTFSSYEIVTSDLVTVAGYQWNKDWQTLDLQDVDDIDGLRDGYDGVASDQGHQNGRQESWFDVLWSHGASHVSMSKKKKTNENIR